MPYFSPNLVYYFDSASRNCRETKSLAGKPTSPPQVGRQLLLPAPPPGRAAPIVFSFSHFQHHEVAATPPRPVGHLREQENTFIPTRSFRVFLLYKTSLSFVHPPDVVCVDSVSNKDSFVTTLRDLFKICI
jgi:hypothetical protein